MLVYAVYKFELLIGKEQSSLSRTTQEDYFKQDYTFSSKDGFKVAFALSSYTDTSAFYDDRRYGKLRVIKQLRDSKTRENSEEQLKMRHCTYDEIANGHSND